MFRLHGLLVISRPLVYTQPHRCLKKHRALYAYRRAGAGGISLSADAFRDTPRVAARCVLVFFAREACGDCTFASLRASPAPVGRRHSFRKLFHALAFSSLISRKTFLLPAGSRACTSVRLTNRHFVPSRAKNEEEEAGVAGHRFAALTLSLVPNTPGRQAKSLPFIYPARIAWHCLRV